MATCRDMLNMLFEHSLNPEEARKLFKTHERLSYRLNHDAQKEVVEMYDLYKVKWQNFSKAEFDRSGCFIDIYLAASFDIEPGFIDGIKVPLIFRVSVYINPDNLEVYQQTKQLTACSLCFELSYAIDAGYTEGRQFTELGTYHVKCEGFKDALQHYTRLISYSSLREALQTMEKE